MRFASLGSGSRGNALVVEAGDTRILLDCGFSTRATLERLAHLELSSKDIDALLVTHEHSDHIAGVFRLSRRFGIPVYLTHGTYRAVVPGSPDLSGGHVIDSHCAFSIGHLEILPFPVPHDAREPVQYVFSDGGHRLGVLTDTGSITPHIVDVLQGCDALVLECNHDAELLAASAYPMALKRRISGNYGHLENSQAASLLQKIETKKLQHVVAAHLSEQNNHPERVIRALASALNCTNDWIGIASQDEGFGWRQLV